MCTATWKIFSSFLAASLFPHLLHFAKKMNSEPDASVWFPDIYCLYPSSALSFSSCWNFLVLQIILSIFGGGKERRFDLGLLSAVVWDDPYLTLEDGSYHHLSSLNVRLPHLCNFKTLKMTKKGGFFPLSVGRVILFFFKIRDFQNARMIVLKLLMLKW